MLKIPRRLHPTFSLPLLVLLLTVLVTCADNSGQTVAQGKILFDEHCSACHRSQGQGGIGLPLNVPEFINNVDDFYLKASIQRGRPGRIMPSFDDLNTNEINTIVSYMRSWTGKPGKSYPATTISADIGSGKKNVYTLLRRLPWYPW
ncbi:MAG: c-type cytochrome [Gammaproteobacteria bacterium]|nr:c-type cytochrome [Gammaproteobacteria bacterium]